MEGHLPGEMVSVDNPMVKVRVDVWAAPWIDVGKVQIFVNGHPRPLKARSIQGLNRARRSWRETVRCPRR